MCGKLRTGAFLRTTAAAAAAAVGGGCVMVLVYVQSCLREGGSWRQKLI